jgi:hypothetical protein
MYWSWASAEFSTWAGESPRVRVVDKKRPLKKHSPRAKGLEKRCSKHDGHVSEKCESCGTVEDG